MGLGVEGMMISPGYSYSKAPDQDHFLSRRRSQSLFQRILDASPARWKFNQSPVFLEFLKGDWDLECRPWGTPTYNLFGWQRPCYLLDEGHSKTFRELMDETNWDGYGRASGNPKCGDCMVHCGYEPAAVEATFGSLGGLLATARLMFFGPPRRGRSEPTPLPSPALHLQPNGLPALPVIDRVA
jgi:hopanoid biosynthesis associated radical SAM protein HpnH